VVRRALLRAHVVGVKADMALSDVEWHCRLAGRETPDAGDPQLDYEAAPRCEVACGVSEAGDLLGLGPQVANAVPYEVDERELAWRSERWRCRRADGFRNRHATQVAYGSRSEGGQR
jgi:hypothetical protein